MEIEQGHSLPEEPIHKGGMPVKYPFAQCDVGDSFFIEGKLHKDISGVLAWWNKKLAPARFKASLYDGDGVREEKDGEVGIRVHRIV